MIDEIILKVIIAIVFTAILMIITVRRFKKHGKFKKDIEYSIFLFVGLGSFVLEILYMPLFLALVLPALVGIILVRIRKKNDWETDDNVLVIIIVIALFIVSFFCICYGYDVLDKNIVSSERILYQSIPLVAVEDGQTIHGSFVFASGSVNGYRQYEYYYRDDGAIKYDSVSAFHTGIFEENRNNGAIETYQTTICYKKSWISEFIFGQEIVCKKTLGESEIHVPIGTVKRSMSFDLKG